MKCSNCGNEMVHSRNGWLCISCGHVDADPTAPMSDAQISTGKDSHDQMRSAKNDNAPVTPDVTSQPIDTPASTDDSAAPVPPVPPADDTKAADEPTTDVAAAASPTDDSSVAAVPPEDLSAVEKAVEQVEHASGDDTASDDTKPDDTTIPSSAESEEEAVDDAADESAPEPAAPSPEPPVKDDADDVKTTGAPETSEPDKDVDEKPEPPEKDAAPDKDEPAGEEAASDDESDKDAEPEPEIKDHTPASPKDDPDPEPETEDEAKPDDEPDDQPEPKAPSAPEPSADDEPKPETETDEKSDAPEKDDDAKPEDDDSDTDEDAKGEDGPEQEPEPDAPKVAQDLPKEPASTPPGAKDLHAPRHSAAPAPDADVPEPPKPVDEEIDDEKSAPESLEQVENDEDLADKADTSPADAAPSPEAQKPQLDNPDDDPAVKDPDKADDDTSPDDKKSDDDKPADEPLSTGSAPPSGPDAATTPTPPPPASDGSNPPPPETPPTPPAEPKSATQLSAAPGSADSTQTPPPAGQAPGAPATPADAPAPPGAKPALTPQTHPRPVGPVQIIALVVVVLIAAALVIWFFMKPKVALGDYLNNVASSHSTQFTGSIAESSPNFRLAATMYGTTDFSNRQAPEADVSLNGQVAASAGAINSSSKAANGPLAANFRLIGKTLYAQSSTPQVLSELAGVSLTSSWYKYDLSGTQLGKCTAPEDGSGSFFSSGVIDQIPITAGEFGGVKSFSGTKALYFSGTVDDSELASAVAAANKTLQSGCQINLPASAYRGITMSFQLWHGWSKDQLQINVSSSVTGSASQIILDTFGYGSPVTIPAPPKLIDAQNIFHNVLGAETTGSGVSPGNVAASARARDAQREVILQNYLSWYKAGAIKGLFVTTPPALAVQVTDPQTGKPYLVTTTPPSSLGQIWYHAGGSCTGPSLSPGPGGSPHLALVTILESGQRYCVDAL